MSSADLPRLYDFEEIRVQILQSNSSLPTSRLLGENQQGKDWRIINFSATESVGVVLLGKRKPATKGMSFRSPT